MEHTDPGSDLILFVSDVTNLASIRDLGCPSTYCVITQRPPLYPKCNLKDANAADLAELNLGCVHGCGMTAVVRLMTGEEEPLWECFFCDFTCSSRALMYIHIDHNCELADEVGYNRTDLEKQNDLPPLKSTGCGKYP